MSFDEDDTWHTYSMDAVDALRQIEASLLVLESDPRDKEVLNQLYRALHTLKGNSALLGLTNIETLAHAAEDMIGHVRDRGVVVDQDMIDLMLKLIDRLREITEFASSEHRDVADDRVRDLTENVRLWSRRHGYAPSARPSGASRGDILLWSDPPAQVARSSAPDVVEVSLSAGRDPASLELFLALYHELRGEMQQALAGYAAQPGTSDARATLVRLAEDLGASAERMGYPRLVEALQKLAQAEQPERAREALASVESEFDHVEASYGLLSTSPRRPSTTSVAPPRASVRPRSIRPSIRTRSLRPSALRMSRLSTGATTRNSSVRSEVLRIDARKVSTIMDLAGEIALASGAVTHHPELEGRDLEGYSSAAHKLEMLIRELQNEVSAMRLVPVAGVFERMKRVVRDGARRTGKRVELVLLGEETEIDKVMVDRLQEPLVHLLRNAVDHGIEPSDERVAAGKPPVGRIVLEAYHQGGEVSVRVRDDGRGLNRRKVLARAIERGLVREGESLTEEQIVNLIFLPGFSTKDQIDEMSGRGVGMDVIKTSIEGLRGRVRFESTEGVGSSLELTVPLTLAFVEAMVVRVRDQLYALPIEKVFEVFQARTTQLASSAADGQCHLRVREHLVPVLWLHRFYGGTPANDEHVEGRVVVVVQTSRGRLALPVDTLLGNQPVMLKPLQGPLASVRAAAGCGMLRSGEVALALDCERLHA